MHCLEQHPQDCYDCLRDRRCTIVLMMQVLRGNIRVMCRVRPPLSKSPSKGQSASSSSSSCITVPLEGLVCVSDVSTARQREFEFDACFGPEATQEQVREWLWLKAVS